MSRTGIIYPPHMLPKAADPETAQIIILQPSDREGTASAALRSPAKGPILERKKIL